MPNLTQGDTGRGLELILEDEDGVVNLTGATVLFLMGSHVIDGITGDAANGEVLVHFLAEHTAVPGSYQSLVRVTYSDGNIEHFPSDGYISVNIQKGVS